MGFSASKSHTDLTEAAYVHLIQSGGLLSRAVEAFFREHGLTGVSYNILRILRGAGSKGITCTDIRNRMLTRVPDVTRLVDRLERDGLVERKRVPEDRRVVLVTLSAKGKRLLTKLDEPLKQLHLEQLGHLNDRELEELLRLLEKARSTVERD